MTASDLNVQRDNVARGGVGVPPRALSWHRVLGHRVLAVVGVARAAAGREPALDMVRGVAIFLAIGWHFNTEIVDNIYFDVFLEPGRKIGWAGVDLFFVLSGFLIGRNILKEVRDHGDFSYGTFLIRRIFRLWPVLFVFLFVHVAIQDRPWNSFLFQTILSVQNYTDTSIPILWSLAVEEHFYLVIGVLFMAFPRGAADPRVVFIGLTAIMLVAPALRCVAEFRGWSPVAIQWQTQFRMDALACGVLLAAMMTFKPALFERIAAAKAWLLAISLGGGLMLANTVFQGRFLNTIGYSLSYVTCAAFIMLLYRVKPRGVAWVLAKPLIVLGVYAYPLYIWQFAGLSVAGGVARHVPPLDTPGARVIMSYGFAVAIAAVISMTIEQPFMRMGKALARPRGGRGRVA